MSIILQFHIDLEKYARVENHKLLMKTEQYIIGAEILTKLTIYESLKTGISYYMPELETSLQTHLHFLEQKNDPDKKQRVYEQYFHSRLKAAKIVCPSYYEVLEEWIYADKMGATQKASVAILQENDGKRIAQVEFETEQQASEFVSPDWLISK